MILQRFIHGNGLTRYFIYKAYHLADKINQENDTMRLIS